MKNKTVRKWVRKTDLLEIRAAEDGKMVAPDQFSKPGDMIVVGPMGDGTNCWEDDFLIRAKDFPGSYIEIDVPA